jgi:hypothetical protein
MKNNMTSMATIIRFMSVPFLRGYSIEKQKWSHSFSDHSAPGWRQQESAGRLINLFAEAPGEGRREQVKRVRVPGMTSFPDQLADGFRGLTGGGGCPHARRNPGAIGG